MLIIDTPLAAGLAIHWFEVALRVAIIRVEAWLRWL